MRMDTWFHFILDGMEQVEQIPQYFEDYGVSSFKFYMGGYEPGNPIGLVTVTDAVLYVAMEKIRELGPYAFCMVHCEDDSLVSHLTRVMKASGREDLAAYSESRPDFVEEQDLVRAIWLAKLQKCSLYVPHTTVGMAVAAAGAARLEGHRITLETCPHYLALTYDDPTCSPAEPAWARSRPLCATSAIRTNSGTDSTGATSTRSARTTSRSRSWARASGTSGPDSQAWRRLCRWC